MEVDVIRRWLTTKSTIGELRIDGAFVCYTLEDYFPTPYLKVPGKTCIPLGRYPLIIGWSNRYQRDMPRICDVPDYQGILMHWGNYPKDTLGCVLVGMDRGQDEILRSRVAFDLLFPRLKAAQGPMVCNVKLSPDVLAC